MTARSDAMKLFMETLKYANAIQMLLFKSEHRVTPKTEFMHFLWALGQFVPNILEKGSCKSEVWQTSPIAAGVDTDLIVKPKSPDKRH